MRGEALDASKIARPSIAEHRNPTLSFSNDVIFLWAIAQDLLLLVVRPIQKLLVPVTQMTPVGMNECCVAFSSIEPRCGTEQNAHQIQSGGGLHSDDCVNVALKAEEEGALEEEK